MKKLKRDKIRRHDLGATGDGWLDGWSTASFYMLVAEVAPSMMLRCS